MDLKETSKGLAIPHCSIFHQPQAPVVRWSSCLSFLYLQPIISFNSSVGKIPSILVWSPPWQMTVLVWRVTLHFNDKLKSMWSHERDFVKMLASDRSLEESGTSPWSKQALQMFPVLCVVSISPGWGSVCSHLPRVGLQEWQSLPLT